MLFDIFSISSYVWSTDGRKFIFSHTVLNFSFFHIFAQISSHIVEMKFEIQEWQK